MQKQLFRAVAVALLGLPLLVGCGGLNGPLFARVIGDVRTGISNTSEDLDKMSGTSGTAPAQSDPSSPTGSCGFPAMVGEPGGANAMAEGMNSMAQAFSCGGAANAYAKGEGSTAIADSSGRKAAEVSKS